MIRFPDAPERIRQLRTDHRGFPVPWFVAWIDGKPDFRVIGPRKIEQAVHGRRCWICGKRLGLYKAFVIGPMCAVNRVSSEPPSHRQCATFAARACPFLSQPKMRRNEIGLPEERTAPGVMITRNPGVALVWVTTAYTPVKVENGTLFDVGEPASVHWYALGREATRAEVEDSIRTGLPILEAAAIADGPAASAELLARLQECMALLPPPTAMPTTAAA